MPDRPDLVINTGPILALAAAGQLEVLRTLFSRVIAPYEVVQEIEAGGSTQFACEEFRALAWLDKRKQPTALPAFLKAALDPGEAAVIALATAEKLSTVAIDEVVGRRIARLHELKLTGSLGMLIQAKQQGAPIVVKSAIGRMRAQGIWLSQALEKECLRQAGEE